MKARVYRAPGHTENERVDILACAEAEKFREASAL